MVEGVGDILARQLLETLGDVESIFRLSRAALAKVPGIGSTLIARIQDPEAVSYTHLTLPTICCV